MDMARRSIRVEHHGSHHGQHDLSLVMTHGEDAVARIDYSEFERVPLIQYIWVEPHHRRRGLATALLHRLQREYPTTEIDWGSLTTEGAAFKQSLSFVEIPNRMAIAAQAQVESLRGQRDAILESRKADYSALNDLHDRIGELENGLARVRLVTRLLDVKLPGYDQNSNRRPITMNAEAEQRATTPPRPVLLAQDLDVLQRSLVVVREFGSRATPDERHAIDQVCGQLAELHSRAQAQLQAMRFRVTWDESFVSPGTKVLGVGDFEESRGYTPQDIDQIRCLGVGQTWASSDYGASHTVTRLQDLEPTYVPRLVDKSREMGLTEVPSFMGELYRRAENLGDPDPSMEWLANEAQCLRRQISDGRSRYSGEKARNMTEEIDGFLAKFAEAVESGPARDATPRSRM